MNNQEKIAESVVLEEQVIDNDNIEEEDIFSDIKYICSSTSLITESLQSGCDVAQLPNGNIIISEVITVNVVYGWDKNKQKMVKISQS